MAKAEKGIIIDSIALPGITGDPIRDVKIRFLIDRVRGDLHRKPFTHDERALLWSEVIDAYPKYAGRVDQLRDSISLSEVFYSPIPLKYRSFIARFHFAHPDILTGELLTSIFIPRAMLTLSENDRNQLEASGFLRNASESHKLIAEIGCLDKQDLRTLPFEAILEPVLEGNVNIVTSI